MSEYEDSLWGLSLLQEWMSGNKYRSFTVEYSDHKNGELEWYVNTNSTAPAEKGISGHGYDTVLFDAICEAITDFNRQNSGGI